MDDSDPLIPRASIALLALVLLGASINKPASAKEVPKIIIPTATASPMPTNSPTPTKTRTPKPTPTITEVPTPTLTLAEAYATDAVDVTANLIVRRCLYYVNTTLGWLSREDSDYRVLTVDDLPLILAVMAKESACNPYAVSVDGYASLGLMQVIPKPWLGSCLNQVPCNIYWGIWILDRAIEKHGLEIGLAAYNCSLENITRNACGPRGGVYYSEHVRMFWFPRFVLALEE